jgi:hypothetical protein
MIDSKRRKIVVFTLFGGFVLYIALKTIIGIHGHHQAIGRMLPSTYSIPKKDSSIIVEKYRHRLVLNEVKNTMARYPISLITLDGEYSLIMTRLKLTDQIPVPNMVNFQNKSTDRSTMVTYSIVDNNAFKFHYNISESPKPVSKVYLTIYGDSIQRNERNDSITSYSCSCKNLSIRYGEDDPVDIFVESDKNFPDGVPLSILFYRKNNGLYFLLLSPNDKMTIDSQLLSDLVSGS